MKLPHVVRWLTMTAALLMGLLFAACGPDYPDCENDEHCVEAGEYCFQGKCSQCRENAHCSDPSMQCNSGSCQKIPGYCDANNPCPPDKPRCVDNRCQYECNTAQDCGDRETCENHKCVPLECVADSDCAAGQRCENNKCVGIPLCEMATIYFDFDEYKIRSDAQDAMRDNKTCHDERAGMGSPVNAMTLVGHADERGTEEYNMALSEKRAQATLKAFSRLGVSERSLNTQARGEYELAVPNATSESQHQRNRRVVFKVQ